MAIDEKDVFVAALAVTGTDEREAYLQAACAGHPELLGRLRELLSAHEESQGPLDRRPVALDVSVDVANTEGPGSVIGPYTLIEQIGEGGMGTVWMAQQTEPVKRLVAIKLIKAGMDSRQVIARFEAERQALALMEHGNIARVLDAGTTSAGRPFFAMDLVKGVPITRYCDEHYLTPRQRLELFLPVCQAVQHAHQKGIIHRDLKPSNVLVALYDGKPVPKVIDFGVAKAAGQQLTDKTLVTGFGALVGTLEYMSPEQVEINQLDVDTRSDIYSLGVLLYELLAGSPPFSHRELDKLGMLEILRVIREREPPKPSTRLSTADGLPTLAANRGTEPKRLTSLVRGELDWIVMKALEKDRNRRYPTTNDLIMDIQRYLSDETVLAGPPSATYRLRKLLSRNRGAVLATATVLLALVGGIVGTTTGLVRAERARHNESAARDQLEVNLYFQTIALAERHYSAGSVGLAERLLDSDLCPGGLRGWEWHYLKGLCKGDATTLRQERIVVSLAVSPNGGRLATGSNDGMVTVWDTHTWHARSFRAHANAVTGLVFARDGSRLWSAGGDGAVYLWDLGLIAGVPNAPGRLASLVDGRREAVLKLALSPDGRLLATAASLRVSIWDTETGHRLLDLVHSENTGIPLAFSPDGRLLLTGLGDRDLIVWDTSTWQERFTLRGHRCGLTQCAAFRPDGRQLASASCRVWDDSDDCEVIIWDLERHTAVHTMHGLGGGAISVAFSPDGHRLATGGAGDPTIKIWDVSSGQEALTLRGHREAVNGLAFSSDGYRLFSVSADHTVRVWDGTPIEERRGAELRVLRGHEGRVNSLAFTWDGRCLVSGGMDGTARLWDVGTGRELRTLIQGTSPVYGVALSPDSTRLATGSFCGFEGAPPEWPEMRIWDAAAWREEHCIGLSIDPGGGVNSLAFSPSARHLVVARNHATVVDVATGLPLLSLRGGKGGARAVACDNGRRIAWGTLDGKVMVWDGPPDFFTMATVCWAFSAPSVPILASPWPAAEARPTHVLPAHSSRVMSVAFAPDGRRLASCGIDGVIKVWDLDGKGWTVRFGLSGHLGAVHGVAFSSDGRRLASAGLDGTIRLWDMEAGKEYSELRGHTNSVYTVVYSPDGRYLASGGSDGTIRIWDANPMSSGGRTAP